MRKIVSLMLAFALLLTCAFAEGRGTLEIVDEDIEGEDILEEEFGDGDAVVFDPDEELMLDSVVIESAFETLDNVKNILLLGMDSRGSDISGRTDTMILLTVDVEKQTIKLTSFLRDTYVEIPGRKNNRLNAAYVFGGYDLLSQTLQRNFGVTPDAYVAINLAGLVDVIDQLGGVTVNVKSERVDRVNAVIYWYNIQVLGMNNNPREGYLTKGGEQLLNGKQAEAWARYRHSESDFQRSARQRELIMKIFEKICTMSVGELATFAAKNVSMVKTNMSITDIIALAPAVLAMRNAEIQEMQIPLSSAYKSQTISGMSVLVPDRQKNVNALAKFLAQ